MTFRQVGNVIMPNISPSAPRAANPLSVADLKSPLVATRSPHPSERIFRSWPA